MPSDMHTLCLQVIDLGGNVLEVIQANSLYFSARDMVVWLYHNHINYIDDLAFSHLQPGFLDVSYNKLTTLDEDVFQVSLVQRSDYLGKLGTPVWLCRCTW